MVEQQAFNLRVLGSIPNALNKNYKLTFMNRDKYRRTLYLKNLKKRTELKIKLKSKKLIGQERCSLQLRLSKITRSSAQSRIRNRCIITGRGRGLISLFNISRIKIKELTAKGALPGVRKSTW